MRKYHLGGFGLTVRFEDGFLYKNEPLEAATVINQLQKDSEFPLIFAADFEHGLGMRLDGVTDFPQAMAFGATGNVELARQSGRITAQEARAIGVQWNWFPDVDVNSNPANPIINTRSFGESPKLVGDMAAAYIAGAHQFGMMTTAKHFPGHGNTESDSHVFVPVVKGDAAHLEAIELPPFRAAIRAGVDAVMIAHVLAPVLDHRSRGYDLARDCDRTLAAEDGLSRTGHHRRPRHGWVEAVISAGRDPKRRRGLRSNP